ncbi:MAG TPA: demethoxyubiquinone hydroxylase family protein [Stellaceae bacterium]|nr:demethoxyubiquinone hydroxylase family protein [Stellaceae bacterium]
MTTPTPTLDRYLPGDPGPEEQVRRMIRVDHAGEVGATRIYAGQLAVLGKGEAGDRIRHMAEQERVHKETFDRLMVERRVRPTLLSPIWDVAGYALGVATALMGERAAMACTVAVEEVIDEHYQGQVEALGGHEPALRSTIETFRTQEIEHRDIGLAHGAEAALGYEPLTAAIKLGSRLAIWLSTRI